MHGESSVLMYDTLGSTWYVAGWEIDSELKVELLGRRSQGK